MGSEDACAAVHQRIAHKSDLCLWGRGRKLIQRRHRLTSINLVGEDVKNFRLDSIHFLHRLLVIISGDCRLFIAYNLYQLCGTSFAVLLANSCTCKFHCCYLCWQIQWLTNSAPLSCTRVSWELSDFQQRNNDYTSSDCRLTRQQLYYENATHQLRNVIKTQK